MAQIALVIGGTAGLGRAIAIALASHNPPYTVIVSGRNATKGAEVVSTIEAASGAAEFLPCDVTSREQIRDLHAQILRKYGKIDVAVNSAGVLNAPATIANASDEDVERTLRTNVEGTYYAMQSQIRAMLPRGSGHIVNLASVYGLRGCALAAPYVASKHAIIGMTKSAGIECAKDGVWVNCVAPGIVPTAMVEGMMEQLKGVEGAPRGEEFLGMYPAGRFGREEEVVRGVLFLVGAEWVAGSVVEVDGGFGAG